MSLSKLSSVGPCPVCRGTLVTLALAGTVVLVSIKGVARLSYISGSDTFLGDTHANMRQCYAQRTLLCPPTFPHKIILSSAGKLLALAPGLMSHTHPTAASSSSSNFQLIINNALNTYKKQTKNDLRAHPLAVQLQSCDSPSAIITILQEQLQGLDRSRSTDQRWTKWLDPTVSVLYAFSNILGTGVSLVCFRTSTCSRSTL